MCNTVVARYSKHHSLSCADLLCRSYMLAPGWRQKNELCALLHTSTLELERLAKRRIAKGGCILSLMQCSLTCRSAVYEVQACTREEIDEAFAAAKAAQKEWGKTPLWKRAELLKKAAVQLREHAPAIAEVT